MPTPIRLLVRADDAGSSLSSNLGCLQACTQGVARSVEVMMPCTWAPHAAQSLNAHSQIDIGIHLTLASEWDAVKWRPLTHAPSLVDDTGYFLPLMTQRKGNPRPALANANWSLADVAQELRAQVALGIKMFKNVSHVSTHMMRHLQDLDPRLGKLVTEICAEFNLADDAFGHGLPRVMGYPPHPRDTLARVKAFKSELSALKPGTYIFIDHPATPSPELDATGHTGYEDVAADRVSCLETLTSPALMDHIKGLGIELISYKNL